MAGKKGVGASAPTQINVVNAEALKVGPDEVLIIKIGEKSMPDDGEALLNDLSEILTHVGLKDRSFVVTGDDIEFAVVKKDG